MVNVIKPYVVRTFDGNGCETSRRRFKSEYSAMKAASSMSKMQHIIEYDTVSGDCTNGDIAEIKPEYRIIRDMR